MRVTSVNVGRSRSLVAGARHVASAIGKCAQRLNEPRLPCLECNAAMGLAQASTLMSQSGCCGFYLAVRQDGTIEAREAFTVEPGPREVRIDALFGARTPGARVGP